MKIGKEDKIRNFTDLVAWQEAHKLVLEIYKATAQFPREERYGLIDQLRRAALSITANIAEGFSRFHYKERLKFYYTARGSVSEIENDLIAARDLGLVVPETYTDLFSRCEQVRAILNGLIKATASRR